MAMIKCANCGKDVPAPANFCCDCGTTLAILSVNPENSTSQASGKIGDLNGDGKIDWEDFKIALSKSKKYASDKVNDVVSLAQDKMKSAQEKDAAAVEELVKTFEKDVQIERSESQVNREKFQSALTSTIDVKFAEIMVSKKETEAYLTYVDAQILTAKVRGIFKNVLSVTPPQVEAACLLSETILAPSTKDKENNIKAAIGIAGGTAGIGIVIGAIGSALGWGAGIIATLGAWFVGTSIAGPIGWGAAGLSLAVIAGYFASTSNQQTDTERFLRVLKSSIVRAVDAIWLQYETELSRVVTQADNDDEKK
ncbi:zinc ribbon domain-containing protein [Pelobacter propionicus]|nr:zinc ribbon domain-containing protein [Pelobacter propionicus]